MKHRPIAALVVTMLVASSHATWAQPRKPTGPTAPAAAQASASRVFLVRSLGESFELTVHPSFVTVLYFPETVVSALSPSKKNKRDFDIRNMGDRIALQPMTPDPNVTTNLNITTAKMKVSVILRVVPKVEDAVSSAYFKHAAEEEEFQRRVDEEVARLTEAMNTEYRIRLASVEEDIRRRGDAEFTARLLRRHEVAALDAVDRNGDGVIVRVLRAIYVGEDAYLVFEVQNRDSTTYRIAEVVLRRGREVVSGAVSFAPKGVGDADAPIVGMVPSGKRGTGVVIVRDVDKSARQPLTLELAGPGGTRRVAVGDIVLK